MSTALIVLLFLLGVALIVKGGDAFVDASSWIAEAFHIPKFMIGATIVSLATTLPELLVSSIAASQGRTEMAIGNAVGSVTANVGLIMGISILCMPSRMKRGQFALKGILMIASAGLLYLLSRGGSEDGMTLYRAFRSAFGAGRFCWRCSWCFSGRTSAKPGAPLVWHPAGSARRAA